MIDLLFISLALAIGSNGSPAASDDARSGIEIHSQDSQKLRFHRSKVTVDEETLRVHGWVKPAIWFDTGIRGQVRIEAWSGNRCVEVRHVRWSLMTSNYMGHFVAKFPQSVSASDVRISHVGSEDPAVCPADSAQP